MTYFDCAEIRTGNYKKKNRRQGPKPVYCHSFRARVSNNIFITVKKF